MKIRHLKGQGLTETVKSYLAIVPKISYRAMQNRIVDPATGEKISYDKLYSIVRKILKNGNRL